ncbi:MAG: hypothetical protein COS82_01780 [Zetaproteobacteria bacterium CG06_land_8_20_14_3_00_59_53]|nr:MAG: hypothetical protein COX56_03465 [Zetaproteobacteria bacterium CG23_combo_of_CG06-09_8_20_14_all_59_86]PIQ64570.1 MAG: hypothetical protein COV97_08320 [Zetaproteobacteria bacterium CG11_big_fil_rev_8_21_14_0_20_59_439]PIU71270.1 MAG: hypothetical protein COS82_01780 [Zetaproteobacteria bacterium CG06_land_8_20_14_3_00_59_53]PIU97205.1 MAG: hypothetical protein COS62_04775 [Zetaproteobacteria bacterium CG03_land_8_20_14_0_80_59_51]PIY45968.1 MAG: hypothetical protein COZ02_07165 [Zetapr
MGSADRAAQNSAPLAWLFLLLLLLPIAVQLAGGDLRNPWRTFQMALYVCSAWLVYRMSGSTAGRLLGSHSWSLLLGITGNIAVLFAVLQQFHLPLFSGFEVFPIWQAFPVAFAGMHIQQNMQGLFLVLVCMPLWARAMSETKAWPWWLASLLPCAGLLATSSRGSALVLLVGAAMLLWISTSRLGAALRMVGVLLLAGAISHYWHMYPEITGLEATLTERMASVGMQGRFFVWEMCWRLFLEHPWLGIGAGNLMSYGTEAIPVLLSSHPEYAAVASVMIGGHANAHNLILQFLMEWGVLGGAAIIGLIGFVAWRVIGLLHSRSTDLCEGRVQAGIGSAMMLLHGMFSVSMMQGYFVVLLALYSAALFVPVNVSSGPSPRFSLSRLLILMIPALFVIWNWQLFVTREWRAEDAANLSIDDAAFARDVGAAVDNPWSSRAALQWYIGRMVWEHEPARIVASENFIYRYWMMHQGTLSLRYLILLAHLKDDTYAERRWSALFMAAYPEHRLSPYLKEHLAHGHAEGEAIDLGL